MKATIPMLLVAAGLLTVNCKDKTGGTTNTATAVDSTGTAHDGHATTADAGASGLMESMNDMMDKMHSMEMSGNADHDLAMMMNEHHRSAVDMADIILTKGNDEQMKALAQKIKNEQKKEMEELGRIQYKYKEAAKDYDPKNSKEGLGKAMMDDMMSMMKMPEAGTGTIDKEFAVIMTKHHQDGIKMAGSIVKFAKDPQLKSMAQKMIDSQGKDVKQMQDWLAKQQ